MSSDKIRRDISRSHTVVIDGDEWIMPDEVAEGYEPEFEGETQRALARPTKQIPEGPKYGQLPKGVFGC